MSTTASAEPGERDVGEFRREDEQAEHDEERHLGEEGEPLVKGDELAPVARRRAADGEPDEVDGKEAAAAEHVRRPERERRGGERGDGGERADRVREATEDPGCERSEGSAHEQAEAELLDDQQREVVEAVVARPLDPGDQADRERDRHRVVAARLGFERAGERAADVGEAQRREDGGCIGGGDDRAEQDGLEPWSGRRASTRQRR